MLDLDFMASYYREAGFVGWLEKNKFHAITAANAGRYYAVYNQLKNCEAKQCVICPGYIPKWTAEHDVQTGKIKIEKCRVKEQVIQETAGASFSDRHGAPLMFRDKTLSNTSIIEKSKQEIDKYIIDFPNSRLPGLYLYSAEHHIGRTTAMWHIIKELLSKKKLYNDFIMTSSGMFAEAIIRDARTDDHFYFDRARNADLLAIDDFGSERYTDGYVDRMIAILEDRYWNKKPILLSSTRAFETWAWHENRESDVFSKLQSMTTYVRLDEDESEGIKL
jgi:DNA replication protein DnaC